MAKVKNSHELQIIFEEGIVFADVMQCIHNKYKCKSIQNWVNGKHIIELECEREKDGEIRDNFVG